MGNRIKWRFLIKLVVVLIVAGVAIHLVHRWQVRSQVGAFLHQADLARDAAEQAEKDKKPDEASADREREQRFLQRYVLARPDDIDGRERLARLMCKNAKTRSQANNAYFVLEDVLRRDPNRHDLRRFTIDYAMNRVGFVQEAKENLEYLFDEKRCGTDEFKRDGELKGWYARCFAAERNFKAAEEHYGVSRTSRPDLLASFLGQALMRRQLKSDDISADDVIHEMMAANRDNFNAYLYALKYLKEFRLEKLEPLDDRVPPFVPKKRPYTHEDLVGVALQKGPEELEALIAAAELALVQRREMIRAGDKIGEEEKTRQARMLLSKAINLPRQSAKSILAMAALEAETRRVDEAINVIQHGLADEGLSGSVELLVGLMDYQFQKGDAAAAKETLKKLEDRGLQPGVEEFESARVLILEDKWREAAATLEQAVSQLEEKSAVARQAYLLLGRCNEQLGEHERRLRAYTHARSDDAGSPLWGAAMLGIAESQAALGRADEALNTYSTMTGWVPAMWVPVARLEFIRALRLPAEQRDWSKVDAALAKANEVSKDSRFITDPTDLRILQATVQHYKGDHATARKTLGQLLVERPTTEAVRIEIAMQSLREEKFEEALATLEIAAKELGDSADIRLARARVWAAKKDKELPAKLLESAARTEQFSLAQKRKLLRGLAEIASSAGVEDAADRLWDELSIARPFDIGVQLIRFDRAVRAKRIDAMRSISARIGELEGETGRSARFTRAVVHLYDLENPNSRAQALKILDELEREQSAAPPGRVLIAQGLVHELNQNRELAIAKYRQAYERGEASLQAIQRLFVLLSSSKNSDDIKEAQALLEKLEKTPNLGPDLQRLAAAVSLRADDPERALAFAENVYKQSEKYEDQIALGHMYWRSKKKDEEKDPRRCFQKATDLAPEVMNTWLTLMQYLLATGKKDEAAKVFEQARDKVKPTDRAFFSALGHAQLGETEKAVKAFEQARNERPTEVRILSAEADYSLQRGQLAQARDGFKRILALASATNEEKVIAQQRLALAIAADPTAEVAREALKHIPQPASGNETPAQKRARAVILGLQKEFDSKKAAIRLLEENESGSNPGERFFLAQLYNSVGNRTGVPLAMDALLQSESNRNPLYLRFYVRWLIRDGQLARAAERIDQLSKVDPESLGTAELKARLAAARKDLRGAWEALRPRAEGPNAPIDVIAGICEDIGLYEEAERLLKRLVEQYKQSQPKVVLALATFHGRRGRTNEGLQICEEMRGKLPLAVVADAAVTVLYHAPTPSASQMENVAAWVDIGMQKATGPERNTLLQHLAAIRNLQGRYNDAARIYEDILKANSKDPLALNNLAFLLSALEKKKAKPEPKRHTEAIAMIEEAKKIMGDHAVLLDTEALIWLNADQPERAYKLMETVVAQAPSGTAYYHLAQAAAGNKKDIEARVAWRRAHELGLKPGDLHPLEREEYDRNKRLGN
jgi:predicted Zn-dependent protease